MYLSYICSEDKSNQDLLFINPRTEKSYILSCSLQKNQYTVLIK